MTPKLKKKIEKGLKASWSPEQICGRYQLEQKDVYKRQEYSLPSEISSLLILVCLSTVVGDEKLTSRENLIGFLFFYVQSDENTLPKGDRGCDN